MTLPAPDHPITGTIDAIEDNSVRIYTGPYAWSYDVISGNSLKSGCDRMSETPDYSRGRKKKPLRRK